jgi:2-polyprenyl-6-methoxyphenol hydroxylase-like FAD-dependent oxidoreductase
VDVLIAGLGPGGCAAALAAHAEGLSVLAVEARGVEATRSRLILVRPGAQAALARIGLPHLTEDRRTTTIEQVENRLRQALIRTADTAAAERTRRASPALDLCWHTSVTGFEIGHDPVQVTLTDAATGQARTVVARHLIDASGGRLEALGRQARVQLGRSHWVATAQYDAPPERGGRPCSAWRRRGSSRRVALRRDGALPASLLRWLACGPFVERSGAAA